MSATRSDASTADREIVIERVFDLYRELATRERAVDADRARAAPGREPRTVRETVE